MCLASVTFIREWTLAGGHLWRVGDGGSGDFARGGDTSKCLLAAALAAASHHSAQQYGATRGQKPARSPERERPTRSTTAYGHRKRPLQGTPPEPLEEVAEMQGAAVTVGYVAAPVSLLVAPSMTAGDGVDVTTTKWLLKVAGRRRSRRRKEKESEELLKRAQGVVDRAASLPDLTSSFSSVPGREEEEEEEEAQTSQILFLRLLASLCSSATCSSSPRCTC